MSAYLSVPVVEDQEADYDGDHHEHSEKKRHYDRDETDVRRVVDEVNARLELIRSAVFEMLQYSLI